jgi:hypothetical protein
MNLGEKIAKAKEQWARKAFDHYSTPEDATQTVVNFLWEKGYTYLRVREPCCGDGRMARALEWNDYVVDASDIRETGYGKGGVDYTKVPERDHTHYDFEAVITNPPFNDAEAIIRRALRDAPVVCMLLSNNYWHAASRHRLFVTRPPSAILALCWRVAFLEEERGSSPLANMMWVVWEDKHQGETAYIPMLRPDQCAPRG